MNRKIYHLLFDKISKDFNLKEVQIVTSDLLVLDFLLYLNNRLNNNLNVFFVRKNRVKSGTYSKIEGKINNKKILVIENIIKNKSNISYIESCLELEGKKIDFVFSPFYNESIKINYNHSYSYEKIVNVDNIIEESIDKKLFHISEKQNIVNLYKKNDLVGFKDGFLSIDDNGVLNYFNSTLSLEKVINIGSENFYSNNILIDKNNIYIISDFGNLIIIDSDSFSIKLNLSVCDRVENKIELFNNKIYILGINNSVNNIRSLYIYDIFNNDLFENNLNYINSGDFFIFNDLLLYGSVNGELIIDDFNKKLIHKINGNIVGGFTRFNNFLLFCTTGGYIYVYSPIDNKIIFSKKISNFWILSKPLVYNDKIYITSVDKRLYIFDFNFNLDASFFTKGRLFSNPLGIGGNVIFGSNDSRLYILDKENKLKYYQFSERIISDPIKLGNKIIVKDFLNNIYKINNECK